MTFRPTVLYFVAVALLENRVFGFAAFRFFLFAFAAAICSFSGVSVNI